MNDLWAASQSGVDTKAGVGAGNAKNEQVEGQQEIVQRQRIQNRGQQRWTMGVKNGKSIV